jgi:hypothetical protein
MVKGYIMEKTKKVENAAKLEGQSPNEIAKTWISGNNSVTMIIEKRIAEEYDLTEPSHVVLERTKRGILIRRLHL